MKDIVIIGGGGHAKVVCSILKDISEWKIIGYTDDEDKGPLNGVPWIGSDQKLANLFGTVNLNHIAMGVGTTGSFSGRARIFETLKKLHFQFPPIVSPHAIVDCTAKIGDGTVVMGGVVIQSDVVVGDYGIINTGATVDHDCTIGRHVHIAPGVNISGDVTIGDNVFLGIGSAIIQEINICPNIVLGAGAVVTSDITTPGLYFGIPAKLIRSFPESQYP